MAAIVRMNGNMGMITPLVIEPTSVKRTMGTLRRSMTMILIHMERALVNSSKQIMKFNNCSRRSRIWVKPQVTKQLTLSGILKS